jgi:hypothetical protein
MIRRVYGRTYGEESFNFGLVDDIDFNSRACENEEFRLGDKEVDSIKGTSRKNYMKPSDIKMSKVLDEKSAALRRITERLRKEINI